MIEFTIYGGPSMSLTQLFFALFLMLIILQRLLELSIAKRNGQAIKKMGGFEVGRMQYPFFILLHSLFFLSLIGEFTWRNPSALPAWWWTPFFFFLTAQGLRYWAIRSLGLFWNTRIYLLPGTSLTPKGPYRYIRHPNYLAVMIELLSIPLIFGLYRTAILFSILNFPLLLWRIKVEEKALSLFCAYETEMGTKPRLLPPLIHRLR